MRKKSITFLCLALLLLVVLAFTYAEERNQAKPSQFNGSRGAQSAIKKNRQLRSLKEKMNQSPEYANLPAEQKVRIILRELKKVNQDDKIRKDVSKKSRLNPKVAKVSEHSKLKVSKPLFTQSKK